MIYKCVYHYLLDTTNYILFTIEIKSKKNGKNLYFTNLESLFYE